jgi:D-amino peptidase
MNVYIITDLEGVTGVTMWSQVGLIADAAYDAARRMLMHDLDAAVEGCREAGADRIVILDGHGMPLNFVPELMRPDAEYVCGRGVPMPWGLDEGFDVGMQVGCHAMNRTPNAILCHTQNHINDARYWYNGREMGEIGQCGLVFGHFDIPCVLVTGDLAACQEAEALFGPQCATAAVKSGLGRQCGRLLGPEKTHALIKAAATEAVKRAANAKPLKLDLPIQARLECLVEPVSEHASWDEIIASPHRTHEGPSPTQLNVYSF